MYKLRAQIDDQRRQRIAGGRGRLGRRAAARLEWPHLRRSSRRRGWDGAPSRRPTRWSALASPPPKATGTRTGSPAAFRKAGCDFAWGDTFPHEANMDRLHGVDFHKGCYVGQEVVSRVQHRGLARKRVTPVRIERGAPAAGAEVLAGDAAVGVMGSSADGAGLGAASARQGGGSARRRARNLDTRGCPHRSSAPVTQP